ncbi:MAG: tyrosine-protein phosphatase [Thermoanaerobaculaceae bacterium]
MIDIHVHVLPGIDDGPADLGEAVEMCRMAAADGVTTVVATPHQVHEEWENTDAAQIRQLCAEVEGAAGQAVHVLPGAEIRACMEIPAGLDDQARSGLLSLAGSRYVLVEPSPYPFAPSLGDLVYELCVAGWRPVLAHPERYGYLAEDPERMRSLVGKGALLQVSAGSVTGSNGRRAHEAVRFLMDNRLAHFLASDGHDRAARPPRLGEARALVAGRWGETLAEALTEANPRAVIEDRPLEWEDPR